MLQTPKRPFLFGIKSSRYKNRARNFLHTIWKNQAGLGLVEMAIVLIVIGVFLTGVVSRGRKMISDAQLLTTVTEISEYARALSDFMKNTGKSAADLTENKGLWSEILGKRGKPSAEKMGNGSISENENHSPSLRNGGFLFIEDKDGVCYLVLGKKGKSAFMTQSEAAFLKDRLGEGVEIISKDQIIGSNAKSNQSSELYALKIPVD